MRTRLTVVAAIGAAVLLAGCGGKPDDGSKVASISGPSSSAPVKAADNKSDEDKMREFAKCMREHGVDMPDPKPAGDGGMAVTLGGGDGVDRTKVDAAQNACKHLMPNGGEMKPPSPEELDKMRKDAKCMRDHGIDMPDPDPTGKGAMRIGSPGDDPSKFEAAAKACGLGMSTHAEAAPAQ
jgi:outer membrane murein-binding lipoprotein Lpp